MEGLRILSFKAENIKRLSVVQITPTGALVQIAGKNGNGKTSVMDAVWWALDGASNIQGMPVRKGKKDGEIIISLGDDAGEKLRVTRNFVAESGNNYLKIDTPDGFRPKAPQQMLAGLVGALSFDPMDFMAGDAKKQFGILRGLVTFDVDIPALEKAEKEAREARTAVNRDLSRARGAAENVRVPEGAPTERIDTSPILDALANVDKFNAGVRSDSLARATTKENHKSAAAKCADIEQQIAKLQRALHDEQSFMQRVEAQMDTWTDLPTLIDAADVMADLQKAEALNRGFDLRDQRARLDAVVKGYQDDAALLTTHIDTAVDERTAALARAKMPIEGLSMEGETVTFNGIPLVQASGAERLRVSTAIGAALNPKLRVMMVRNGNDLDDDGLKLLSEFATANNMQIWIERIAAGDESAVILEDGHVKGQEELVEAQAAAEAAVPPGAGVFDPDAYLATQEKLVERCNRGALEAVHPIAKAALKKHPEQLAKWNGIYLNHLRRLDKAKE